MKKGDFPAMPFATLALAVAFAACSTDLSIPQLINEAPNRADFEGVWVKDAQNKITIQNSGGNIVYLYNGLSQAGSIFEWKAAHNAKPETMGEYPSGFNISFYMTLQSSIMAVTLQLYINGDKNMVTTDDAKYVYAKQTGSLKSKKKLDSKLKEGYYFSLKFDVIFVKGCREAMFENELLANTFYTPPPPPHSM